MSVTIDTNFNSNLLASIEKFLFDNVVTPYNGTISATNTPDLLEIRLRPQDEATVAYVPCLILPDVLYDTADALSTGMGDTQVWLNKRCEIEVYPALQVDPLSGAQKSSMKSTSMLHSLFDKISTALTISYYDYSNPASPVLVSGMYGKGRKRRLNGKMSSLALHRNRFDYEIDFRIDVNALNG